MTARDGILLVDKPAGITSHTAVGRARRALGGPKGGHAGTLDPAATGLLVLGFGAGTRLLRFFVGADKAYDATIRLGVGTATDDAAGQVTAAPGCDGLGDADVAEAVAALSGPQRQRPAAVSAVKVGGRRAHERVRSGEDVELPERDVVVDTFEVLSRRDAAAGGVAVVDLQVRVEVSSGTYVRALARDLGSRLGTAGHLTALRRTRVGPFDLGSAVALDEIDERTALMPLGRAAAAVLPVAVLDGAEARAASLGTRIPAGGAAPGLHACLDGSGGLVAVAEADEGRWRYAMVVPRPQPDPPADAAARGGRVERS